MRTASVLGSVVILLVCAGEAAAQGPTPAPPTPAAPAKPGSIPADVVKPSEDYVIGTDDLVDCQFLAGKRALDRCCRPA